MSIEYFFHISTDQPFLYLSLLSVSAKSISEMTYTPLAAQARISGCLLVL